MSSVRAKIWPIAFLIGVLPCKVALAGAPPPVPFIDWSGVYAGLHVGYGGGMSDFNPSVFDFPARGFLGGGQVGINKQIASLVFGVELSGSWADINGSQTDTLGTLSLPFGFQEVATTRSGIDGLVTLSGRAGLAADRWFVFARGGLTGAWERHSEDASLAIAAPPSTDIANVSGREFRLAPMLGFGAEYAVAGNWSMFAEYDYIHLDTRTVALAGTINSGGVATPIVSDNAIMQAVHVVKLGANYRLGRVAVDPTYPPVMAAAGYNWTGAYIGAQGGYGFGRETWPDFIDPTLPGFGAYNPSGGLAGVSGGVNVQSGSFVFGVEGEWNWTGIKGSQSVVQSGLGTTQTTTLATTIDWLAIASARAGFVVRDRLLVYGKAGVAIADEKHSVTNLQDISGLGTFAIDITAKAVHTGVAVGLGGEYALTANWSAKVEYDYIKMLAQPFTANGTETFNIPTLFQGQIPYASGFGKMPQDLQLLKFGVNYHFSAMPGAPSTLQ